MMRGICPLRHSWKLPLMLLSLPAPLSKYATTATDWSSCGSHVLHPPSSFPSPRHTQRFSLLPPAHDSFKNPVDTATVYDPVETAIVCDRAGSHSGLFATLKRYSIPLSSLLSSLLPPPLPRDPVALFLRLSCTPDSPPTLPHSPPLHFLPPSPKPPPSARSRTCLPLFSGTPPSPASPPSA